MIRRDTCFLCGRKLEQHSIPGFQIHPVLEEHERDCEVELTDAWGVCVDYFEAVDSTPEEPASFESDLITFYPPVDECLEEFFDERGLPRLGGASSGRGWTSFGMWQRCPYAWKRRYVDNAKPLIMIEPASRAIGSLVHAWLAVYYSALRPESPYANITPTELYEALMAKANPELVGEAWRVFSAYKLYYKHDATIVPLAIEHDLRDPRTGESCRYDMVAFQPEQVSNRPPGTYIWEHKTTGIFSQDNLSGWSNDGEILGEVMLWKRLGLDKRFGELKGVVVNILGKQKEPKFHREYVSPSSLQLEQHRQDLKTWEGMIQLARATGIFPRARNNCIGRWGRCDHWDECAVTDLSIDLIPADGR